MSPWFLCVLVFFGTDVFLPCFSCYFVLNFQTVKWVFPTTAQTSYRVASVPAPSISRWSVRWEMQFIFSGLLFFFFLECLNYLSVSPGKCKAVLHCNQFLKRLMKQTLARIWGLSEIRVEKLRPWKSAYVIRKSHPLIHPSPIFPICFLRINMWNNLVLSTIFADFCTFLWLVLYHGILRIHLKVKIKTSWKHNKWWEL